MYEALSIENIFIVPAVELVAILQGSGPGKRPTHVVLGSNSAKKAPSDGQGSAETSRLIVKNLPKGISEAKLKDHFQSHGGRVTDVKIMQTKDGNSRQFGFVGFSTPEEAASAIKYFDRTFLATSRIFVLPARPKGDTQLPRAWSRYSEGSSRHTQEKKAKEEVSKKRPSPEISASPTDTAPPEMPESKKRKLEEFLGVSSKGKLWENDGGFQFESSMEKTKKAPNKTSKAGQKTSNTDVATVLKEQDSDSDSDEEYQDFFKLQNGKHSTKPGSVQEDAEDDESEMDDDDDHDDDDDDIEKEKEHVTPKLKKPVSLMEIDGEPSTGAVQTKKSHDKLEKEEKKPKYASVDHNLVADTGRLFIRNLPFTASEDDIRTLFSRFGAVSEVHLSIDKLTKKSKGFGFVLFIFPAHAMEAQKKLDGHFFQGRILHILPAKEQSAIEGDTTHQATQTHPRNPGPQIGDSLHGNSGFVSEYQKKKAEKQKQLATQDYNWNSLFIRPDAVASAMSSSLGVSKSELLDPESSSSMAVRLALGETNIIKETKDFLSSEGVSIDALKGHYNKNMARSSTVLLVKNIPTNTQIEELRNVFGRFGTLVRVVMPPSRTLSVIEFAAPTEARAAFKHLAYKQFKDAPLFLEWAPVGVLGDANVGLTQISDTVTKSTIELSGTTPSLAQIQASTSHITSEAVPSVTAQKSSKPSPADPDTPANSAVLSKMGSVESLIEEASLTLFIKNLSFATSEESLLKLIERLVGAVSNVSIAMHMVKGEELSQGYGFVECKTREQAVKAWKQLQGSMLDGHQLQVSFSQRKAPNGVSLTELQQLSSKRKEGGSTQPQSTKIMVKNVPFEATRNEIRDLFAPFGELRSVRLPNKPGGKGHRGFAFVEFVTPDEAATAVDSLGNTHLYNRRLVIDYAEQDGDVEAIRAKTAAQYEN